MLDMKALPLRTAAALAVGLREDSRAKLKLSGRRFGFDQILQMRIFDCLNWLKWSRSRACELGYSAPPPLEEIIEQNILQAQKREEQRLMGFDSPEELTAYIEKQRQISDNRE